MEKIHWLEDWALEGDILDEGRLCEVDIGLIYPDVNEFIEFKPKDRIKKIDRTYKKNLKRLISLGLFENFERLGTKKRPTGVKIKTKLNLLAKLSEPDFVERISIKSIDHAKNIKPKEEITDKYYCIKMTVIIDFEGIESKKQKIETRFVLIKAKTADDAYDKLEKTKDEYTHTYLNSDGRLVRWRIDSFDDCYETDITKPEDMDQEEGVEIYSKLGSRKARSPFVWDGK